MKKLTFLIVITLMTSAILFSCSKEDKAVFVIGGIPDQNTSTLNERFEELAQYLEDETGIETKYIPSTDYSALVTAFGREDIQLGWFGGLTGVQARNLVEGSEAIAHRPRDEKFQSVFIARKSSNIQAIEDLNGHSFTFGSESSTSGHLMPRFFLMENGILPDESFDGKPNYSGSHDKTWALVEAGSFDAGALNIVVWESAVSENKVDLDKVDVFYTTPHYFDYNWTIGNVDEVYGKGTKEKIQNALLSFGEANPDMMALFQDDSFVKTNNANYNAILEVAKALKIIQ